MDLFEFLAKNLYPAVLCCIEDEGAAGDGGGNVSAGNSDGGGEGGGDGKSSKSYTDEEVQQMLQKERDSIWAEARRKYSSRSDGKQDGKGKAKADGDDGESRVTAKDVKGDLQALRQELRFERLARKHQLSDEQAEVVFDMYKAADPDDGDVFIERLRKAGMLPATTNQSAQQASGQNGANVSGKAQTGVPANVGAGRKVSQLEQDGLVDVFSLSEEELDRLGTAKVVELYEKAKAAARAASGRPQRPSVLNRQR